MEKITLIFVYGTLKNKQVAESFGCKILRDAHIYGDMYDLDAFPGLINAETGSLKVQGKIMEAYPEALILLDHYEGVNDAGTGLYTRRTITTYEGDIVDVYELNVDVNILEGREKISSWPTKRAIKELQNVST